jgi:hypothetical protein
VTKTSTKTTKHVKSKKTAPKSHAAA